MTRTAYLCSLVAGLLLLSSSASAATPAVAAGVYHVLLLLPDGTVRGWGTNNGGMLGDGTTQTRTTPVTVLETPPPNTTPSTPLSDVIAIATGMYNGYALKADHTVWAWGANGHGELGDGTTTARNTASSIPGLTNVAAIAAGPQYALALKDDGTVWMWGFNIYGQKGDGTASSSEYVTIPVQIAALGNDNAGIGASESASQTAYAIKTDGTVWAWGFNQYCTLGIGSPCSYQQPSVPVQTTGLANISAVAPGGNTTYAIDATGQLYSWGDNQWGEVGNNSTIRRDTPLALPSLTSVVATSGGEAHALAALADGSVWAWGYNSMGQLGGGTAGGYSPVPIPVPGPTNVVAVSGGSYFSVAVSSDGRVWTWGYNHYYTLGDGTNWDSSVPLEIFAPGFSLRTARPLFSLATGTYSVALNVTVTCDTPGVTIHYSTNGAEPTTADPTVAPGGTIAITSTTTLKAKAWVDGMAESNTQTATYTLQVNTPTFSPGTGTYTSATNVTISTSTGGATIRYTTDGSTPTASSTLYSSPVSVQTTSTLKAVAFKTNWSASTVGSATYTLNFGPLSTPTASPTGGTFEGSVSVTLSADSGATIRYTTNGADPTATSTPYTQTIPITITTTLKAKAFQTDHPTSTTMTQVYTIRAATPTFTLNGGSYAPGTMLTINGDASTTLRITLSGVDPTSTDPAIPAGTSLLIGGYTVKVRAFKTSNTDSNVASATYSLTSTLGGGAVAAGSSHTVLATPDGLVYGWGLNSSGQVGDSTNSTRSTPKLIPTLTGVTKLAAGSAHTLAVTWDGRLFAWGSNGSGRLGDGGTTNKSTPTLITAVSNVIAVAAGTSHSLALTADGHVYSWGAGSNGQLGMGSPPPASVTTPSQITSLANIVAIGAGDAQSFAITSGGQLYAWGYDGSSVLGDGLTAQQNSPKLITGISGVAAIMGGTSHTIARLTSGAVYSWGANGSGQLGQGNTTPRTTPTLVNGLSVGALVSSGANFGAAVRSDGVLVEWGLNSSGQLGIATPPSQQTAPTVVVGGPANVALLAAGATHTVAVTPDGHVWTWGSDGGGQLGDNTIGGLRSTPQDVFSSAGAWGGTPVPMLTLAPGTYHSTQTLSVSAMNGAIVHYTTTGATPTESDPVVSGVFSITQNITYGFRAFTPGLAPSAAVVAPYELQPLAPTASPGVGTYASGVSVTLQAEAGTTIRYTLDGSTPTAGSPTYSSPIGVNTSLTVRAQAVRTGWTDSAILVAPYVLNFGTLGQPIAVPTGGTYYASQTVSLQADAGATIRYTLDGSIPTSTSAVYSAPIAVSSSLTLKAIAFAADWTPSSVMAVTYSIIEDSDGPTIIPTLLPAPTSAGWNNTPVEVNFSCVDDVSGVQNCPASFTVSSEGANQSFSMSATDRAGNLTDLTFTVSIDLTAPTIATVTPANASQTTDDSIAIVTSVSDTLSGMREATCNGTAATIVDGAVNCSVSLAKGVNAIVVQGSDYAGNTRSAGLMVTRTGNSTALTIVPAMRTITVGETVLLQVRDDFGQFVPSITWTSDNGLVAAVDAQGLLTAESVGQVVISGTSGSLSAQASIEVVAAGPMPVGTVRWSVDPRPTYYTDAVVGVAGIGATSFASIETAFDATTGDALSTVVRGLTEDGAETFSVATPMGFREGVANALGDNAGGVVLTTVVGTGSQVTYQTPMSLVRIDPTDEGKSWRYDGLKFPAAVAQSPDGTLFVVSGSSIVGIDGATGQKKFQIMTPSSHARLDTPNSPNCSYDHVGPSNASLSVRVDATGLANVLVFPYDAQQFQDAVVPNCITSPPQYVDAQVLLYRVAPDGSFTQTTLHEYSHVWNLHVSDAPITFLVERPSILPDDEGGVLAYWSSCTAVITWNCTTTARYVNASTISQEFELPSGSAPMVSSAGSIGYYGGSAVTAFDMKTGTVVWSAPEWAQPVAALNGGRLAIEPSGGSGPGTILGATGAVEATGQPRFIEGPVSISGDTQTGFSLELMAAASIVSSPAYVGYASAYPLPRGDALLSGGPPNVNTNYNAIELITTATVNDVWNEFIRTFQGINSGDVATATISPNSDAVSAVGNTISFTLNNLPAQFGQFLLTGGFHFDVEIVRYDTSATTITAFTMLNHPLYGYRYFRVFAPSLGRLVVETGAIDRPNPGLLPAVGTANWLGFWLTRTKQLKVWEEDLQYIHQRLQLGPGAQQGTTPQYNVVEGIWDVSRRYIMTNVCGHEPTSAGLCQ